MTSLLTVEKLCKVRIWSPFGEMHYFRGFLSNTASSTNLLLWRKDWWRLQESGELFQSDHSWETPASSIYRAPPQRRRQGQIWSEPEKKECSLMHKISVLTLSVNSLLAYLVISFLDWPITPARVLYSSPTCKMKSCSRTFASKEVQSKWKCNVKTLDSRGTKGICMWYAPHQQWCCSPPTFPLPTCFSPLCPPIVDWLPESGIVNRRNVCQMWIIQPSHAIDSRPVNFV